MEICHKKIKDLRIKKGISQEKLAEISGLTLRTIQRIENGETIPRGDSLKRIASALGELPELFIKTEKQKDENIVTLLNLVQLGFILFPPLGIIFPLIIWIKKRDKIDNVEKVGKSILNFQISWNILLIILIIFFFIGIASIETIITFKALVSIPIIIFLYLYNFIIIVMNTIFYKRKRNVRYFPSIKFFK